MKALQLYLGILDNVRKAVWFGQTNYIVGGTRVAAQEPERSRTMARLTNDHSKEFKICMVMLVLLFQIASAGILYIHPSNPTPVDYITFTANGTWVSCGDPRWWPPLMYVSRDGDQIRIVVSEPPDDWPPYHGCPGGGMPWGYSIYRTIEPLLPGSYPVYFNGSPYTTITIAASPYGGIGTADDPYLIWTAQQFDAIRFNPQDWGKNFLLMNDIDITNYHGHPVYNIIGYDAGVYGAKAFTGVFDGNGHTISGFTYSDKGGPIGMFGYVVGSNAQIKNLRLIKPEVSSPEQNVVGILIGTLKEGVVSNCFIDDGKVTGQNCVGILVGNNDTGKIENCHVTGSVTSVYGQLAGLVGLNNGTIRSCYASARISGASELGGLVGRNNSGTVVSCQAMGTLLGGNYLGGLIGNCDAGTVTSCYAIIEITGGVDSMHLGGLCGKNNSGTLENCYAEITVSGGKNSSNIGGFCGSNYGTISGCYSMGTVKGSGSVGGLCGTLNRGMISDCYATGLVNGRGSIGGLCGYNYLGTIRNCYATGLVQGQTNVGGLCGGGSQGTVIGCFWDMDTSGQTESKGGIGKTTIEMKTLSTFTTSATWDFVGESTNSTADTWRMCANGVDYPHLSWEFSHNGDFDCPNGIALDDLLYLASRWLAATPETIGSADPTSDGINNLSDLAILSQNWLQ